MLEVDWKEMELEDRKVLDEWINQISLENSDNKKIRDNYVRNITQCAREVLSWLGN